jgi:glucokinase-like ROK family protein
MNALVSLLRQAIQHAQQKGTRLLGVGISVPGLVDVTSGTVVYAPNLGWHNVPMRDILSKFDVPVFVDNDANAAALGERYFGAAQQIDNFVYIVANAGLGAGIVLGGHLFQGASGYAGEAGHTTLDPNGPLCHCGNRGCWERLASQRALIERVQKAISSGKLSLITDHTYPNPDQITIEVIVEAARQGDKVARRALQETGLYLGLGVANLINIFNPSLVAFGGALGVAEEFLAPVVRQIVSERAMAGPREAAQFVVSAFKSDACVIGGVALVMHDILSRPRLDFAPLTHRSDRPVMSALPQS